VAYPQPIGQARRVLPGYRLEDRSPQRFATVD
jgi:hypothetical protein